MAEKKLSSSDFLKRLVLHEELLIESKKEGVVKKEKTLNRIRCIELFKT